MTVRIAKQPIDLRSKLSELERPIGVKGNELMKAETAQEARELVGAGRKNLMINGDMQVWQRGTSATNISTFDRYTADLWVIGTGNGSVDMSQSTDTPPGFGHSLKVSVNTTTTNASQAHLDYYIEAQNLQHLKFGTSDAEDITLSFWMKSNETGNKFIWLFNQDGNRMIAKKFAISKPNVWERIVITFPGDTIGSIDNNNGRGLYVRFTFDASSVYTGGTPVTWETLSNNRFQGIGNFMANSSNAFYLTGVQLEVGKNATEFEHRSYGEELALCQRYFQILMNGQYKDPWVGVIRDSVGTTSISTPIKFNSLMRSAPSISAPTVTNLRVNGRYGDTALTGGIVVMNDINERGTILIVLYPTASGWTFNLGEGVYINCETTASNILTASSEL